MSFIKMSVCLLSWLVETSSVGFYVISIYETHGEKGKGYHMYPLHMCHNTTEHNTGKRNRSVIFYIYFNNELNTGETFFFVKKKP